MTELAALALFARVSGLSQSGATDLARSRQIERIYLSEYGGDSPSDLVYSPSEGLSFVIGTGSNPGSDFRGRKRLEAEAIT
jgi:hypothetical protein